MSALTPPVAVAAYAASAIADENPLLIAASAVRIALAAFLVPFSFIFNQALLLRGSVIEIILATLSVAAALTLIAIASEGFFRRPLAPLIRLLLLLAGLALLFVDWAYMALALVLLGAAVLLQRLHRVAKTDRA
jgi:TRAP-type uncharacterized transport system fused permease subunit